MRIRKSSYFVVNWTYFFSFFSILVSRCERGVMNLVYLMNEIEIHNIVSINNPRHFKMFISYAMTIHIHTQQQQQHFSYGLSLCSAIINFSIFTLPFFLYSSCVAYEQKANYESWKCEKKAWARARARERERELVNKIVEKRKQIMPNINKQTNSLRLKYLLTFILKQ